MVVPSAWLCFTPRQPSLVIPVALVYIAFAMVLAARTTRAPAFGTLQFLSSVTGTQQRNTPERTSPGFMAADYRRLRIQLEVPINRKCFAQKAPRSYWLVRGTLFLHCFA
jgi:hypothetical protein